LVGWRVPRIIRLYERLVVGFVVERFDRLVGEDAVYEALEADHPGSFRGGVPLTPRPAR
jgi:hypothetical protein